MDSPGVCGLPGSGTTPSPRLTEFTSGPDSGGTEKVTSQTLLSTDQCARPYPSCVSSQRALAGAATGASLSQSSACESVTKESESDLKRQVWVPFPKRSQQLDLSLAARKELKTYVKKY